MKRLFMIMMALSIAMLAMTSCSENYSNGERIGLVTQFSKTGVIWKSHEGHLNLTQTGMNSSSAVPFDFSIDNDAEDPLIVARIDSAATLGWKIKITYHETFGYNWFNNRGSTNHFVTNVEILDKNPVANAFNGNMNVGANPTSGGTVIHDTIYVVIVGKSK